MTGDLYTVRLLGFPLALHHRATEHHEELVREFRLLALDPTTGLDVPRRLVSMLGEIRETYRAVTVPADLERDAAFARGEESIDLVYRVPASAAVALRDLDRLLDEADQYCRRDQLLTLATPHEALVFRRWYVDEFEIQIAGGPATPWPAYVSASYR